MKSLVWTYTKWQYFIYSGSLSTVLFWRKIVFIRHRVSLITYSYFFFTGCLKSNYVVIELETTEIAYWGLCCRSRNMSVRFKLTWFVKTFNLLDFPKNRPELVWSTHLNAKSMPSNWRKIIIKLTLFSCSCYEFAWIWIWIWNHKLMRASIPSSFWQCFHKFP